MSCWAPASGTKGGRSRALEFPGPSNKGSQEGAQRQCQREPQRVPEHSLCPQLPHVQLCCHFFTEAPQVPGSASLTRLLLCEEKSQDFITSTSPRPLGKGPTVLCVPRSFPEPCGFTGETAGRPSSLKIRPRGLKHPGTKGTPGCWKNNGLENQQTAASNPAANAWPSGFGQVSDTLQVSVSSVHRDGEPACRTGASRTWAAGQTGFRRPRSQLQPRPLC